jgi:hypothetical protein
MVKEVVETMLDEGHPKEKLQEPYCYGEWNGMVEDNKCVSCPEVGALAALI